MEVLHRSCRPERLRAEDPVLSYNSGRMLCPRHLVEEAELENPMTESGHIDSPSRPISEPLDSHLSLSFATESSAWVLLSRENPAA